MLCATDIAARGIHVDDVAIVVHVDPPAEHKAYLHRSGRTARAGAGGTVVTIATPDQAGEVRTLARQAGITPEVVGDQARAPGRSPRSTGPAAPYVEPAPVAAAAAAGQAAAAPSRRPAAGPAARHVAAAVVGAGSGRAAPARPARAGGPAAAPAGAHPRRARRARAGRSSARLVQQRAPAAAAADRPSRAGVPGTDERPSTVSG